jgi:hypothetical protein
LFFFNDEAEFCSRCNGHDERSQFSVSKSCRYEHVLFVRSEEPCGEERRGEERRGEERRGEERRGGSVEEGMR